MSVADVSEARSKIIETYARWTALSALRSGAPIKSREDVYTAIGGVDFSALFDSTAGRIERPEFDRWHERTTDEMISRDQRLNVGWVAKILNVYLKTRVYVGSQGRSGLAACVHPPIDAGLWEGLKARYKGRRPDIISRTHCVQGIKNIKDYACYRSIIDGCELAARDLGCDLIEVEQLWQGAEF